MKNKNNDINSFTLKSKKIGEILGESRPIQKIQHERSCRKSPQKGQEKIKMPEKMTTPEELAALLESEDMETEIVTVSGAIVIDSEYKTDFFNALQKLFDEYVYLDDNYHLNVENLGPDPFSG